MASARTHRAAVPTASAAPRLSLHRSRMLWGWVFLSPWIIGFFAFYFLPMLASLLFTFTRFELIHPENIAFIGLENWARLLRDPDMHNSLMVTLRYAVIALPLSLAVPIATAALLNAKNLWGKRIFRTLFYMPYVVPVVSAVYIWNGFLNPESGWLNRGLQALGMSPPDLLFDRNWIYLALIIIGFWGTGNAMLTTLAGMQGVPTELYESAKVDGAGWWKSFRNITLPMISPVIFYNLVLALIGLFRYFDIPYILKEGSGDPGNATLFYNIYFYRRAFLFQDMGYGATLAWFLFIIALAVTLVTFLTARRWVYYAGGED